MKAPGRQVEKQSPEPAPPIHERMLENGLKAIVIPSRQSPIVVCDLSYPVGSFDDPPGLTGLAHFVEHMLFKGTKRFPKGRIDRLVAESAGHSNAESSEDSTRYWFAFPSESWEIALEIEADRMRGAQFERPEVDLERRVIREERARELDTPQGRLDQALFAQMYVRHPYRNPIVGWPEDLGRISARDLRAFYREHYRPEGAVMVIAGDVEPRRTLDRVSQVMGSVPRGEIERRRRVVDEPPQVGRREFVIEDAESGARGVLAWRTAARGHDDAAALDVLADLLCGGRQARLWARLVETERLATWVDAQCSPCWRDGQFMIQIEGPSATNLADAQGRILDELRDLASRGPTRGEIDRARRRLDASRRWERQDPMNLAAAVGSAALWGDFRAWQRDYHAALAVTADDVARAAARHLVDSNLTIGWSRRPDRRRSPIAVPALILKASSSRRARFETEPRAGLAPIPRPEKTREPQIEHGAARPAPWLMRKAKRVLLENGMTLIHEPWEGAGVVAFELHVDAGQTWEAKPGLAWLTGRMLEEGTRKRTGLELSALIENVGGTIEFGSTGAQARVRREDLELAVELMAEGVLEPSFPADPLAWIKRRIAADLRHDLEDPAFRADSRFRGLVYGSHPLGRDPRGGPRRLGRLTRGDLIEHHARYFTPERAILVAVGDFDPGSLARLVAARFGGWAPGGAPEQAPRSPRPRPACVRLHDHAGEQTHLVMGHLGVSRGHPDFDVLVVLDHILGSGPGVCDRLSRVVRDELGLAYAVGGGMTDSADVFPGLFRIYAGVAPADAPRAVKAILEQIHEIHAGRFLDDEVEQARRFVAGSWLFDLQGVEPRADRLLELARHGLDLDEPGRRGLELEGVTPDRVREAARAHMHPERIVRVEVGPARFSSRHVG